MFTDFLYVLREKGLNVSLTEWITFMDALDKGLAYSSLEGLYNLGRMILVKTESDYDKFDMAFMEYFKNVHIDMEMPPEIIMKFLDKGEMDTSKLNADIYSYIQKRDMAETKRMYRERVTEQNQEHNGGNYWIGTSGGSAFGHSGRNPGGLRIGGHPGQQSAFQVMGERKYQDFRHDKTLDIRQFQMAFRRLRQFSAKLDVAKTELDLDKTIDSTCNNGGYLKLEFDKPRKNSVKLLLLFDCGGTMMPFSELCNDLFQAVHKANHFKDVKTYYFHNCIYSKVYKDAECEMGNWVDLDYLFRHTDKDYKVIIVGDAQMAPEELFDVNGNYRGPNDGRSGYEWNKLLRDKYKKAIWLNPRFHGKLNDLAWMESERTLAEIYDMYPLTIDGLKAGITKLMAPR
ncbi:MAG: VWA containing CoxE family protein [Lachnospiraceae bacterium]|nr:VWA containing CoxE family protein [Lachnospiraceae bacterium]MBQ9277301.1 VWA containing CoxE family protein [Lachnospiraceae bacterium]